MLRTTLLTCVAFLCLLSLPVRAEGKIEGHSMPVAGKTGAGQQRVSGTGMVKKVDVGKRVINLSHGPIPAIGWPQMTMDFVVDPKVDLSGVKEGQAVEFTLVPTGGSNYAIATIKPKG